MSKQVEIGDTVLVPCRVIGVGQFVYTEAKVFDLSPIENGSQEPYKHIFTVFADDVITADDEY